MESPVQPLPFDTADSDRLFAREAGPDSRRWVWIGALSVVIHIVLGAGAVFLSRVLPDPMPRRATRIQIILPQPILREPLIEPLTALTQRDPNRNPISNEFNLSSLPPRQERSSVPQPGAAAPPRERVNKFRPPARRGSQVSPSTLPEAPQIETGQFRAAAPPPDGLGVPKAPPPPEIAPKEQPQILLENPGSATGTASQQGVGRIPMPKTSVDEAIREVVRGTGSRGIVVGDEDEARAAANPSAQSVPIPGKMGSSVELLSDPQGVDFRPYLIRVLSSVRRNWFAVIPQSARLGQRGGRVIVQFAINLDGSVPKLVIVTPSGTDALDRAAVASVSASNPFPPLPPEFRGGQIRLQFAFRYNVGIR